MSNNNNNNARKPARQTKAPTGKAVPIKKNKATAQIAMNDVKNLKKKVDTLTKKNATIAVKNGEIAISMPKTKVDGLLAALLEPENAKHVFPYGIDGVAVSQYSGAALSMTLENGLGVEQDNFESYVAETVNPEAPLLVSKNTQIAVATVDANDWYTIESHTATTSSTPVSLCASLWVSDQKIEYCNAFVLPEPAPVNFAIEYNETSVVSHYLYRATDIVGNQNYKIQAMNASSGRMDFWDATKANIGSVQYSADLSGTFSWPGDARYISFTQVGTLDLYLKIVASLAGQGTYFPGPTSLQPVPSPDFTRIAATEKQHRVVSSATCMTYAPDMQYGGGNLLSAILENAPIGSNSSWANYMYTRRRSYLNRALTGGYNVCIASGKTLRWGNQNRYNCFTADGTPLAITQITYTPSAAINIDALNLQVKNHVWYEFVTSDVTRNPKIQLANNAIADRVLSGLALLYRPSENLTHHDVNRVFTKAWHWFNGGSDEATALRKAATAVGSTALKALPAILGAL